MFNHPFWGPIPIFGSRGIGSWHRAAGRAMSDFRIGVSPAVEALKLGKTLKETNACCFFSGDCSRWFFETLLFFFRCFFVWLKMLKAFAYLRWLRWWLSIYSRMLKSCLNHLFCTPAFGAADFDKSCLLLKTHRHCNIFCAMWQMSIISMIWNMFVGNCIGTATFSWWLQSDFLGHGFVGHVRRKAASPRNVNNAHQLPGSASRLTPLELDANLQAANPP